jgi:hypothetical protein
MDVLTSVDLLSRWVHVVAAVVLLGGSIFQRFVLMPAASELSEAEHLRLREAITRRWKFVVMAGIALLLLTGFYNYLKVAAPAHRGDGFYHGLMGTKILLGLGAFFLASVLTGRSPRFEPLRQNRRRWMSILILLALGAVLIGGALKVLGNRANSETPAPGLQTSSPR